MNLFPSAHNPTTPKAVSPASVPPPRRSWRWRLLDFCLKACGWFLLLMSGVMLLMALPPPIGLSR